MDTILHIYSVHENGLNRFSHYSRDVQHEKRKSSSFRDKKFSTNFFALVPQAEKGILSITKIPPGPYKNLNLGFLQGTCLQSFSPLALLFRKLWR